MLRLLGGRRTSRDSLDRRTIPSRLWGELHQRESQGPPACAHGHSRDCLSAPPRPSAPRSKGWCSPPTQSLPEPKSLPSSSLRQVLPFKDGKDPQLPCPLECPALLDTRSPQRLQREPHTKDQESVSSSGPSMVGSPCTPIERSLAHHGLRFLHDELLSALARLPCHNELT